MPLSIQETWVQSPRWGRSLEEETATHSRICLENSVDRGPWWAAVQGVTKRWTQLSDWACTRRNDWFIPDLKLLYFTCLKFPHITKSPNQRKAVFWKSVYVGFCWDEASYSRKVNVFSFLANWLESHTIFGEERFVCLKMSVFHLGNWLY